LGLPRLHSPATNRRPVVNAPPARSPRVRPSRARPGAATPGSPRATSADTAPGPRTRPPSDQLEVPVDGSPRSRPLEAGGRGITQLLARLLRRAAPVRRPSAAGPRGRSARGLSRAFLHARASVASSAGSTTIGWCTPEEAGDAVDQLDPGRGSRRRGCSAHRRAPASGREQVPAGRRRRRRPKFRAATVDDPRQPAGRGVKLPTMRVDVSPRAGCGSTRYSSTAGDKVKPRRKKNPGNASFSPSLTKSDALEVGCRSPALPGSLSYRKQILAAADRVAHQHSSSSRLPSVASARDHSEAGRI